MPHLGYLVQFVCNGHVTLSSGDVVPVVNSFVYQVVGGTGAPSNADMLLTIPNFKLHAWTQIVNRLSVDYIGDDITILFPNSVGRTPAVFTPAPNGGLSGPRLPLKQGVYIKLQTGFRGRSYVGCKRIAPIVEAHATGDELNATGQTQWAIPASLLSTGWKQPLSGITYTFNPVVYSRLLSASDLTIPPAIGAVVKTAHAEKTLGLWRHRSVREELKMFHGARYHFNAPQSIPDGVNTSLANIGTALFDTDSFGVSGQFVIPSGFDGYYRVSFNPGINGTNNVKYVQTRAVAGGQVGQVTDFLPSNLFTYEPQVDVIGFMNAGDAADFSFLFNGLGGDCTFADGHCEIEFLGT